MRSARLLLRSIVAGAMLFALPASAQEPKDKDKDAKDAPPPPQPAGRVPSAGDLATARSALKDGLGLRENGELDLAVERFQTAYDLVQTPVTAFELGKTQMMRGKILEAQELFQKVGRMPMTLEESGRSKSARSESDRLASELEPRIPRLRIHLKLPPGATAIVRVDDDSVPTSGEVTPRSVDPGKHEVAAKAGDGPEEKIEISIGESETKDVDLAPQWIPPKPVPKGGGQAIYVHQTNPLVFIGFGASAASLIFTTAAAFVMVNKTNDVKSHCGTEYCAERVRQTMLGPSAGWSVAFAGGLAGTIGFGVMAAISIGRPVTERVATTPPRATPYVGLGSAGVTGSF